MSIRTIARKLHNNIFTRKAISVLGFPTYASYVSRFALNLPRIGKAGDFRPLDQSMGKVAKKFVYRGKAFLFDCQFCDGHLDEDSFAFGVAREIYVRDCYFKFHPDWVYESARNVIDLGGNRGAFSTLMTTQAKRITIVECGAEYQSIIHHNLSINGFSDYELESVFVGEGGTTKSESQKTTIDELLDRHNLDSVDLIKMDIEGSEFSLFQKAGWLERVKAISMEVHPDCGAPETIIATLNENGFSCKAADENLVEVTETNNASFIYAWKNCHT